MKYQIDHEKPNFFDGWEMVFFSYKCIILKLEY